MDTAGVADRLALRASDAEREQTTSRLREACVEGRLSVAELVERLDAAYAARTLPELDALVADLPAASRVPTPRRRRPVLPGIRGFTERIVVSAAPGRVADRALTTLAPLLVGRGYGIVAHDERVVVFERDERPGWTVLVAVLLFPLGLFALVHRRRSRIVLTFVEADRGTEITASGTAPLPVRRAFTEIRD
jgi:Domain of unknown function (DUF1707)